MRPSRVSEKIQEYRGEKYYLCGRYFQREGVRLHRKVYADRFGKIPDGYHIHHADHDRTNNAPENLELVPAGEHSALHGKTRTYMPREAIQAATEWHGSQAGKDWHRDQYESTKHALHRKDKRHACSWCGAEFMCSKNRRLFCSKKCKTAERRHSGVDDVQRQCAICGVAFTVNRYKPKKSCSRRCAAELTRISKGAESP